MVQATLKSFGSPDEQHSDIMKWLREELQTRLSTVLASEMKEQYVEHNKVFIVASKLLQAINNPQLEAAANAKKKGKVPPSLLPKRGQLVDAAKEIATLGEDVSKLFDSIEAGLQHLARAARKYSPSSH